MRRWLNFDTTTTINTMNVAMAPIVLTARLRFQPGSRNRLMVTHHADLRQREPAEHSHGVQRDELARVTGEGHDQHRRNGGERKNPVREHEPIAAVLQLRGRYPSLARID